MSEITLFAATTGAVAKSQVNLSGYKSAIFSADNLATTEEVDIFINVNGSWKAAVDETGTAIKLTATAYNRVLEGGANYAVDKDATAGNCTVTVTLGPAINE